jgi:23S rRNA-/tRNA-specific pseudouridylate synthase
LQEIKKATKTRTAELSWELIKSNDKYSLLKVLPKTGRFHQIRVQMSEMGHPILGDKKYGKIITPEWRDNNSIALVATGIEFKVATNNELIKLEIQLPDDWKKYI